MNPSEKKVAIVTGSSRGIGAKIAERLARMGHIVIVNYAGNAESAQQVVAKIEAEGGTAMAAQADISNAESVALLFDKTEAAFGGVDILVNNAGIMKLASIANSKDDLIDSLLAVNLKGSINTMREAAVRLRDGGRIVNFSSSVVGLYQPTYGVYAATKAGIEALTHILSKELRGRNITVNAVSPGPTATDLFLDGKSPELIQQLAKLAPLERLGEPGDIANLVAFLVGPEGSWINGQIIKANGGII